MGRQVLITYLALCSILLGQVVWPFGPQNVAHPISYTMGGFINRGFHDGVDIPANVGDTAKAVITGVVRDYTPNEDSLDLQAGTIEICRSVADTNNFWMYGHLYAIDTTYRTALKDSTNATVIPTTNFYLGKVCDWPDLYGGVTDHLHLMKIWELVNLEHPLDSLTPSPSSTPIIDTIAYRKDKSPDTLDNLSQKSPLNYVWLHDSVDIIVKAYNTLEGDIRSGIEVISYAVSDISGNVVIPRYLLMDFGGLQFDEVNDTIKRNLVYATGYRNDENRFTAQGNPYIVTNRDTFQVIVGALSNVKENCWPTKINKTWTANADSIEDAKFPDGLYIVSIKAEDHFTNSVTKVDTVHVDNFNPRVKETYPTNWYHWIARDEREIWCRFSEAMDTATLTTANIKIRSLVDTTQYYTIKKITYIDSLCKLILEVDSFKFHDEVQVILNDSVTDLAGKSIEGSKGRGIAYTWKFTVGVIKITDNDIMDIRPDIYGDKIAWVEVLSSTTSNIKFHDLTSHNTLMLNTTFDGFHNWPIVWNGRVAWREEVSAGDRIFYWDGNSTQLIVAEGLFRNQYDFDSCGVVMYSTVRWDGWYPDTIWVQYYQPGTGLLLLDKYTVKDGFSRNVDVDGSMIVWEHGKTTSLGRDFNPNGFWGNTSLWFERGFKNARKNIGFLHQDNRAVYTKDIYLRGDFGVLNLTSFMDSSINAMPSVSQGQSAWMRYTWNRDTLTIAVWVYDGAGGRQLSVLPYIDYGIYWPEIQNGDVLWHDYYSGSGLQRLHYYDGWQDNILVSGYSTTDFVVWSWQVENNQAVWLQLGAVYYPVYYDGQQITKLLERSTDSYRIGMHQGLVVYDAWDGHDNEIYLYIGDTLKTPPAIVKNLQGEMLGGKLPGKKVKLTWRQNTEADLAGYKIYRSNISYQYSTTPYATILAPETTFIDTLPLEGMNYYVATAYDNLNNESGFSNQTSVFIDNIPPAVPTNLVASYDSITQRVSLIWRSSPDGDLKLYRIYRSEITGNYTNPIDSVFKPDTTFIDSTIYLGKTYYYVVSAVDTNKNESGFSNEDTVVVPLFIASDFALATAYNNGRKIVSSPTGDKVHLVYSSGGGIYYCYSQDSGKSFTSSELIDSPGLYPALSLDKDNNPCLTWIKRDTITNSVSIYFARKSGLNWQVTPLLTETNGVILEISPPAIIIDTTDTVHISYGRLRRPLVDLAILTLFYAKFPLGNPADIIKEAIDSISVSLPYPIPYDPITLTLDNLNYPHISYMNFYDGEVYYTARTDTGWIEMVNISNTPTKESSYPCIDFYGNRLSLVWQEKIDTTFDILTCTNDGSGWGSVVNISSNSGDSKFPAITSGHFVVWQDNTSGNWEVYKSQYVDTSGSWTAPENISNTATASSYPHSAYSLINSTSAKLYCLWTEGDTIPYTIKFKKLDVSPVAKIFADLGQAVQSPYCLERDGYWIFGDLPYQTTDWGYEDLQYKFTGLDPEKEYRMDLAYYFENQPDKSQIPSTKSQTILKSQNPNTPSPQPSPFKGEGIGKGTSPFKGEGIRLGITRISGERIGNNPLSEDGDYGLKEEKGIGRIIQALVVDGIGLDTTFIQPNHLKRISVWLPENTYTDGEIIMDISKIKGKRVVCSELGLYEFSVEKSMVQKFFGPQGADAQLTKPFYFDKIYPNPTKGMIRLRFNSPDERKITIKLYDVCGRLMYKEDIAKSNIGINELLITLKDLSAGIYFVQVEAEGCKRIEKVVLLK